MPARQLGPINTSIMTMFTYIGTNFGEIEATNVLLLHKKASNVTVASMYVGLRVKPSFAVMGITDTNFHRLVGLQRSQRQTPMDTPCSQTLP